MKRILLLTITLFALVVGVQAQEAKPQSETLLMREIKGQVEEPDGFGRQDAVPVDQLKQVTPPYISAKSSTVLTGNDVLSPITTFPWTEDFESGVFPPAGWSLKDEDGDGWNWSSQLINQNSVWVDIEGYNSARAVGSYSYLNDVGALTPDNWLITPALNISQGIYMLKYWIGNVDKNYFQDHYEVMVSTTGTDVADFTSVFEETQTSFEWAERTVSLENFVGQTIYIAFVHNEITDKYIVRLDDVTVYKVAEVDAEISSIVAPVSGPRLSASEVVKATIKNNGIRTITNLSLTLEVDGTLIATESFTGTINKDGEAEYTFTETADLSADGDHTVKVTAVLPGDEDNTNDSYTETIVNYGNIAVMGIGTSENVNNTGIYFYDDGINENYIASGSDMQTLTFYPETQGERVTVTFEAFYTQGDSPSGSGDYLDVYSGANSGSGTLLASLTGDLSANLPSFTSSSADGALTFVFRKQSQLSQSGWKALVKSKAAPAKDISLEEIITPQSGKTIDGKVRIKVENIGLDVIDSFTATYQLNAETPVDEVISASLSSQEAADFELAVPFERLEGVEDYTLTVTLELTGEDAGDLLNNELKSSFSIFAPDPTPGYSESFDDGSIPQEWNFLGESTLDIAAGSYGAGALITSAQTGSNNLRLYYSGVTSPSIVPETNIIELPLVDLKNVNTPVLRFWHAQEPWDGNQDELRVLYKTSLNGVWTELAGYDQAINAWTERALSLPNPSSEYYIAFKGTCNNGHGVIIDNVKISSEPGPGPDPGVYHKVNIEIANGFDSNFKTGIRDIREGSDLYFRFDITESDMTVENILFMVDGVEKTFTSGSSGGSYTLKSINTDHTILISWKECTVTLPEPKGAGTIPGSGKHKVPYGQSFSFTLVSDEGTHLDDALVYSNGLQLYPFDLRASSQSYDIHKVTDLITVTIEGTGNQTSNTEIGNMGIRLWTFDHMLYINTQKAAILSIYNAAGRVIITKKINEGLFTYSLSPGVYIVRLDEMIYKVMVK